MRSSPSSPEVKRNIVINDEYSSLVPEIFAQEYESLKQSIKENGLYVPIILNQHGILLDGHHRYKACQELGKEPRIFIRDFDEPALEKKFIIEVNRNRRHLTPFQRIELQYKLEIIENEIGKAKKRMSEAGKVGAQKRWAMEKDKEQEESIHENDDKVVQNYTTSEGQIEELEKTAALIRQPEQYQKEKELQKSYSTGRVIDTSADKAHVSPMTYFKGREIIKNASEQTKDQLRKGKLKIDKAYRQIQKQHNKQELINAEPVLKLPAGENTRLFQGDFIEKSKELIPDNSIDLLFTDPPYGSQYLPLYDELARLATRVLKDGGSLVVYAGHYAIPEIIDMMHSAGLEYWWTMSIVLGGSFARHYPRKISIKWKPLLWFVKGDKTNTLDFISDTINSTRPSKALHEWEQSIIEAEHVISRLTVENQIVLDPMMGSGTAGAAAIKLKRQFVGIEIDPEKFQIAKSRLVNVN
jgi:ParB-like chromosome segregation protein Spo0J